MLALISFLTPTKFLFYFIYLLSFQLVDRRGLYHRARPIVRTRHIVEGFSTIQKQVQRSGGWKEVKQKEEERRARGTSLMVEGGRGWVQMCVVGDGNHSPCHPAGFERSRSGLCSVVAQLSKRLVAWTPVPWNLLASFTFVFVCVCFFTIASRYVNNLIFMTCSGAVSLRIYRVIIFSWVTIYIYYIFCSPVRPQSWR